MLTEQLYINLLNWVSMDSQNSDIESDEKRIKSACYIHSYALVLLFESSRNEKFVTSNVFSNFTEITAITILDTRQGFSTEEQTSNNNEMAFKILGFPKYDKTSDIEYIEIKAHLRHALEAVYKFAEDLNNKSKTPDKQLNELFKSLIKRESDLKELEEFNQKAFSQLTKKVV